MIKIIICFVRGHEWGNMFFAGFLECGRCKKIIRNPNPPTIWHHD